VPLRHSHSPLMYTQWPPVVHTLILSRCVPVYSTVVLTALLLCLHLTLAVSNGSSRLSCHLLVCVSHARPVPVPHFFRASRHTQTHSLHYGSSELLWSLPGCLVIPVSRRFALERCTDQDTHSSGVLLLLLLLRKEPRSSPVHAGLALAPACHPDG